MKRELCGARDHSTKPSRWMSKLSAEGEFKRASLPAILEISGEDADGGDGAFQGWMAGSLRGLLLEALLAGLDEVLRWIRRRACRPDGTTPRYPGSNVRGAVSCWT